MVIDWQNAARGPASADLAKTWIILATVSVPGSRAKAAMLRAARQFFLRSFLGHVDAQAARSLLPLVAEAWISNHAPAISNEPQPAGSCVHPRQDKRRDPTTARLILNRPGVSGGGPSPPLLHVPRRVRQRRGRGRRHAWMTGSSDPIGWSAGWWLCGTGGIKMSSTIWRTTWPGTGLSVIIISWRSRSKGRSMIRGVSRAGSTSLRSTARWTTCSTAEPRWLRNASRSSRGWRRVVVVAAEHAADRRPWGCGRCWRGEQREEVAAEGAGVGNGRRIGGTTVADGGAQRPALLVEAFQRHRTS